MLTLRLQRTGRKHSPHFRVIVSPKGEGGPKGKPVEYLGWMDPLAKKLELNKDRILYWISRGAQTSATLRNMLIKAGVVQGDKIAKHHVVAKKEEPAPAETAPAAPVAEQTAESAPAEAPKSE